MKCILPRSFSQEKKSSPPSPHTPHQAAQYLAPFGPEDDMICVPNRCNSRICTRALEYPEYQCTRVLKYKGSSVPVECVPAPAWIHTNCQVWGEICAVPVKTGGNPPRSDILAGTPERSDTLRRNRFSGAS